VDKMANGDKSKSDARKNNDKYRKGYDRIFGR